MLELLDSGMMCFNGRVGLLRRKGGRVLAAFPHDWHDAYQVRILFAGGGGRMMPEAAPKTRRITGASTGASTKSL